MEVEIDRCECRTRLGGEIRRVRIAWLVAVSFQHGGVPCPLDVPHPLPDRVTETKEYDACVLGAASTDADPNVDINVWLSSGGLHLWNPSQTHPATPWEAEIDRLFNAQMYARTFMPKGWMTSLSIARSIRLR